MPLAAKCRCVLKSQSHWALSPFRHRYSQLSIVYVNNRVTSSGRFYSAGGNCRSSLRQTAGTHSNEGIPFIAPQASLLSRENATSSHSRLPITCPGCGALSQDITPDEAGFYNRSRKAVKIYWRDQAKHRPRSLNEDSSGRASHDTSEQYGNKPASTENTTETHMSEKQIETPVCDRCHDLIYNNKGKPIAHPTIEDIADSIAESPFQRNHVYHVLDAADFPLSLIPKIFTSLELAKPRSQNRRARTKFTKKPTISFIITRSDLLGPSKEMVDKMMPYFQSVLRDAFGRQGRNMRLGNIHLVSSKRGWWTKEIKDSIWERGGGNWMVGKANVGKSNLFPVLFPKGSGERAPIYAEMQEKIERDSAQIRSQQLEYSGPKEDLLLPPPQPEMPFPMMPVVSHLPGTTASPIRLPFGNHKGELIDLPGLDRGSLEQYVQPDHRLDLIMQHRPKVEQHVIKPGQSLLLGGGLVRITPQLDSSDRSTTCLAYPFVPIDAHITATDKAVAVQLQERTTGVESIMANGAGSEIRSVGTFGLWTDVTKARAGAVMRAGVPLSKLPFRIFSTDLVIEGVGWVELVCQVHRRKHANTEALTARLPTDVHVQSNEMHSSSTSSGAVPDQRTSLGKPEAIFKPFAEQQNVSSTATSVVHDLSKSNSDGFPVPLVEVFTPQGKHIGQRKPLGAWLLWHELAMQRRKATTGIRPRRPMAGAKKREKASRKASAVP